jgi:hypothetical protein
LRSGHQAVSDDQAFRSEVTMNRRALLVLMLAAFSACLAGCGGSGGGGDSTAPTTGALTVTVGFGAVASGGSFCTGNGTISINSTVGPDQSQNYEFSGVSNSTPPACSTSVTFSRLNPGTWSIFDSSSGASCDEQVIAGSFAQASIVNGVCQ